MRTLRRRAVAAAAVFAGGMLAVLEVASCIQNPSLEELAKETVVITQFAPGTDFASYRTFAITDSITILSRNEGDGGQVESGTADPEIARQTLDAIAAELSSRGYQRVDRTAQPDLGVSVIGAVKQNAVVPYGAWWGYGAAAGASWGFTGAAFSTGITSSGIALWASGVLVIELYDLRAARQGTSPAQPVALVPDATLPDGGAGATIPVVWAAFIYGVVGAGLEPTLQQAPIASIEQAFEQSPYLKTP